MELFNTREIAIGIWLLVFLIYILSTPSVRSASFQVVKAFFQKQLQIIFYMMLAYTAIVVTGLKEIGLWDLSQLKDTVVWTLTVALVSTFRVPDIAENEHYFRSALLDNFKIILVFEFVVNFYTAALWLELIIIPLSTFLVMLQIVSERKKEQKVVTEFASNALALIGLVMLAFAAYEVLNNFQSFARLDTLSDFALPIALSILFLPFLYLLNIYVSYERAFIGLRRINDETLRRYIKLALFTRINLRTRLLKRWIRDFHVWLPQTREDASELIDNVINNAYHEANPRRISPALGWPPQEARQYLIRKGLKPADYHPDAVGDGLWFASAPCVEIGEVPTDNLAYHIEGEEFIARTVRLTANFYDPKNYGQTLQLFAECAVLLFNSALQQAAPNELLQSLVNSTSIKLVVDGKSIEIVRENWSIGRGFSLHFAISSLFNGNSRLKGDATPLARQ